MRRTLSRSPEETEARGYDLGARLRGGETVLLSGSLGSGKTTFARGIACALGIDGIVTSPSFAIMNEYSGRLHLFHFDFYRLDNPAEMELLLEDYLDRSDGVVVIEWGEALEPLPGPTVRIRFEIRDAERTITEERVP